MKNILTAIVVLFFLSLSTITAIAATQSDNEGKDLPKNVTTQTTAPAESVAPIQSVLSGKVTDISTGETLSGAEISIEGTNTKVYTDLDGNFTIPQLKPGKYTLICSLISYNKSLIEKFEVNAEKTSCEIALESAR